MIQRIQSIFLLLVAGTFGVLFKVPMALSDVAAGTFLSDKIYAITDHMVLFGLTVLGGLIAVGTIFLFRNRKLQLKLCYLLIAIAIMLPLTSWLLLRNETAMINSTVLVSDQIGMFLPLLAILFGGLASYFIRKDEKLVKSMDRLR